MIKSIAIKYISMFRAGYITDTVCMEGMEAV